ncbi:MAG: ketopantoate reductase family protein [Salinirussus sp.]
MVTDRIGVIGAGAMGALFGGYLHKAGTDVVLIDTWTDHVEAINEHGLRIERTDADDFVVHPPAVTDPSDVESVDSLLVFVKAMDTRQAIEDAEPIVTDETTVITLQNGLTNYETLREYLTPEQVLGGTTTMGASMEGPGHVLHTGQGETKVGGVDSAAAATFANTLEDAGVETIVVDDPVPHIWDKQFVSVGIKPTAALTELLDGPLGSHEETAWFMEQLVSEAVAVAEARGVDIISDDPIETVYEVCEVNAETMSSMLEDVLKERPTEIDHITGAIVRYGDDVGVDTPYNRAATALVKGKQRSYQ